MWFNTKSASIDVGSNLVILNPDVKAMIAINYDPQTWLQISQQLQSNHEVLSPVTRSYLLYNAKNLQMSGNLNCTIYSELIQYLGKETEYAVWGLIIQDADDFLPKSCNFPADTLQKFINSVFDKIGGLSRNFQGHFPDLLSEIITKSACNSRYENCTKAVSQQGMQWFQCIKTPNSFENCSDLLAPAHRAPIYCELARNSIDAFNYLKTRYCSVDFLLPDSDDLNYGLRCTEWQGCTGS